MTTVQYQALESHIAFWGALIMFSVTTNEWATATFFVLMVYQAVRQLYWYSQMVKEIK